ncbi:MAG: hypothetical protein AAF267_06725 [Deinococcota bacterium]
MPSSSADAIFVRVDAMCSRMLSTSGNARAAIKKRGSASALPHPSIRFERNALPASSGQ